jgi:hypothetical protein
MTTAEDTEEIKYGLVFVVSVILVIFTGIIFLVILGGCVQ